MKALAFEKVSADPQRLWRVTSTFADRGREDLEHVEYFDSQEDVTERCRVLESRGLIFAVTLFAKVAE